MDALDSTVPVGEYRHPGRAEEHALVVLAMGLDCWFGRRGGDGGYVLLAEPSEAEAIAAELRAYDREQEEEPRQPIELPHFRPGAWIALLWGTILMAVFLLQGRFPWIEAEALSSSRGLIEGGEWWRPFTSLFLHGDLGHLAGNVIAGAVYAIFVCRALGRVLGWALIVASGTIGNVLTSLSYYPEPHLALGASTAVFGALGILTSYGFYLAFRTPESSPWQSVIVPAGGGLALFGLYGFGGEAVDFVGHLFGFLSGLALGVAASWWRLRPALRRGRTPPSAGARLRPGG